jgi:hypothetical protein
VARLKTFDALISDISPSKRAIIRDATLTADTWDGSTTGFNDGLSVISETTGFGNATQFGRITHAEKNLNKLENNRAKELEKALKELEETRDELG